MSPDRDDRGSTATTPLRTYRRAAPPAMIETLSPTAAEARHTTGPATALILHRPCDPDPSAPEGTVVKLLATTTLAATILLTSLGCSSPPTRVPLAAVDVEFFAELARGNVDIPDQAEAIGIGQSTCKVLDKNRTVSSAITALEKTFTTAEASVIAQAAVKAYCPDHAVLLQGPSK